ncbi:MAG: YgjV family protein [Candidatus Acidiferrales bacterium]
MISSIGWLATALVTASYFFRNNRTLRVLQALGAVVWLTYGILINSKPVIVANVIVAVVALYSTVVPGRAAAPVGEVTE